MHEIRIKIIQNNFLFMLSVVIWSLWLTNHLLNPTWYARTKLHSFICTSLYSKQVMVSKIQIQCTSSLYYQSSLKQKCNRPLKKFQKNNTIISLTKAQLNLRYPYCGFICSYQFQVDNLITVSELHQVTEFKSINRYKKPIPQYSSWEISNKKTTKCFY